MITIAPEELADAADVRLVALHLDALEADFALLDEEERGRAARFVTASLQRRFIAAHAGLRRLLGWASASDPRDLRFDRDAYGKPLLVDSPQLHFSLSHCAGQALVAIGSAPLGVDIEALIQRDTDLLARQILTPAELKRWSHGPQSDRIEALTEAWTLKEALLKACGLGLRRDPSSFAAGPGEVQLDGIGRYRLSLLPAIAGHCAALAQQQAQPVQHYRLGVAAKLQRTTPHPSHALSAADRVA